MKVKSLNKLTDDKIIKKIFSSLMTSPKTPGELSLDCDIPLNDVIRILKTLKNSGLIKY